MSKEMRVFPLNYEELRNSLAEDIKFHNPRIKSVALPYITDRILFEFEGFSADTEREVANVLEWERIIGQG